MTLRLPAAGLGVFTVGLPLFMSYLVIRERKLAMKERAQQETTRRKENKRQSLSLFHKETAVDKLRAKARTVREKQKKSFRALRRKSIRLFVARQKEDYWWW